MSKSHRERKSTHAPLHPEVWTASWRGGDHPLRLACRGPPLGPGALGPRLPPGPALGACPSELRRATGPFPHSTHLMLAAQCIRPSQVDGCLGHCSLCLFKHLPFLLKCSKYLPEKSTFASLKTLTKRFPRLLIPPLSTFSFSLCIFNALFFSGFVNSIIAGVRPTFHHKWDLQVSQTPEAIEAKPSFLPSAQQSLGQLLPCSPSTTVIPLPPLVTEVPAYAGRAMWANLRHKVPCRGLTWTRLPHKASPRLCGYQSHQRARARPSHTYPHCPPHLKAQKAEPRASLQEGLCCHCP